MYELTFHLFQPNPWVLVMGVFTMENLINKKGCFQDCIVISDKMKVYLFNNLLFCKSFNKIYGFKK